MSQSRVKPYEFQVAAGWFEPSRKASDKACHAEDTIVWGGHFREDEDDEIGQQLAELNGEDRMR